MQMSRPVNPQRRRYRSTLRAEQATLTRERILGAAKALFVERGYASATIAAVATAAGISQETVYGVFGGKRGLLEAVIDAEIVLRPEQDVALEALARLSTSRERLRAFVGFCCTVLARTSPIHEVIRGAADSDPFAIELRARLLKERLANQMRHFTNAVRPELRAGLTLRQAVERFGTLTSPELHHLTIVQLGWGRSRHEKWVADLAEQDLLGIQP
jgi:AcrR family transcriptional regulator